MPTVITQTHQNSPEVAHAFTQTENTGTDQTASQKSGTLGKIGEALNKIKTGLGLNKVGSWAQAHPTAAFIVGTALAIVSIVGMATGGPAGVIFGGMGLAAGGYLIAKGLPAAIKKWKTDAPQSTDNAAGQPSAPGTTPSESGRTPVVAGVTEEVHAGNTDNQRN